MPGNRRIQDRQVTRANRKLGRQEERLLVRNEYGARSKRGGGQKDLTPYNAVLVMRGEEEYTKLR